MGTYLHTMIQLIAHENIALPIDSNAIRALELTLPSTRRPKLAVKTSIWLKNLHVTQVKIADYDLAFTVHSNSAGVVEFPGRISLPANGQNTTVCLDVVDMHTMVLAVARSYALLGAVCAHGNVVHFLNLYVCIYVCVCVYVCMRSSVPHVHTAMWSTS
jgi:hypothetical protein